MLAAPQEFKHCALRASDMLPCDEHDHTETSTEQSGRSSARHADVRGRSSGGEGPCGIAQRGAATGDRPQGRTGALGESEEAGERMKFFGRLIAFLALSGVALAFEEPSGFQNVPFGSSEGFIRERHPDVGCSQRKDQYDDILCLKSLSIGDIPVDVLFTLIGKWGERRMVAVDISFAAKNYPALRQAFIDRFGPTADTKRTRLRSNLGVEYEQETLTWTGTRASVLLARFADNLTEGYAQIYTREYSALLAEREKESRERAKRGL